MTDPHVREAVARLEDDAANPVGHGHPICIVGADDLRTTLASHADLQAAATADSARIEAAVQRIETAAQEQLDISNNRKLKSAVRSGSAHAYVALFAAAKIIHAALEKSDGR